MKKQVDYLIEISGKRTAKFKLSYEGNILVGVQKMPGTIMDTNEQKNWFWDWVPRDINELGKIDGSQKVTFKQIPPDLSFERFWDAYGYKVGKKSKAAQLWNAMSEVERILCLGIIARYDFWLAAKGIEKAYPTTFLGQRRWENYFII
ncbi:MAG: hypothetical protein AAFV95_21810 [Bacteroidota bacterium]